MLHGKGMANSVIAFRLAKAEISRSFWRVHQDRGTMDCALREGGGHSILN